MKPQYLAIATTRRPALVSYANAMLRNRADAEDCVQEAMLRALMHADQFAGTGSFTSWMYAILTNECRGLCRKRRPAVALDFERFEAHHDLERTLINADLAAKVLREIPRIPAVYRPALIARDVDELDNTAAAERLGLTVGGFKSRVIRARREVRARLARPATSAY